MTTSPRADRFVADLCEVMRRSAAEWSARWRRCPECNGKGALPALIVPVRTCETCGGEGWVEGERSEAASDG